MRIGYPCINRTLDCSSSRTFRLKSYSAARLVSTVESNLDGLMAILRYNVAHGLLNFRITSDLVPFASHPVCRFDWAGHFRGKLREVGRFIRRQGIRISMHPDQFTLINSPDRRIFERSHRELRYHALVLDTMGLPVSAKIQVHVGGVYGDKPAAMARFVRRYARLDPAVRRRLVIENDDGRFHLADCLRISEDCRVPVLFDTFHHELLSSGETMGDALVLCSRTWKKRDGLPMVDFSDQEPGGRRGRHAESIDLRRFRRFLEASRPHDFDLMLEIKDKEKSALRALRTAAGAGRLDQVFS